MGSFVSGLIPSSTILVEEDRLAVFRQKPYNSPSSFGHDLKYRQSGFAFTNRPHKGHGAVALTRASTKERVAWNSALDKSLASLASNTMPRPDGGLPQWWL